MTIPFAILDYVFRKLECEPALLLLGLVLGKLMEEYLRRAMTISRGVVILPGIAKKRDKAFAEEET